VARLRMRIRTLMLAVMILSVILATAVRWVDSGCPVGFTCSSGQTRIGGRVIGTSSDHLLSSHMSVLAGANWALLDVEGRKVVVRGREVAVDGATPCLIPAGCKRLDFKAVCGVLRVSADGKPIQEIRR
jgi:hypothetical protein